jgi:hypothetical protein
MKTQVAFADEMAEVNGISIERLIQDMRDKVAGVQSNGTGGYDEGIREEQVKITYRMIVRLLHPDRHACPKRGGIGRTVGQMGDDDGHECSSR